MFRRKNRSGSSNTERGASFPEFAIGGMVFLTAVFGIIEFSRLLWTHNALTDAVRKGARYAATTSSANSTAVKNMVVYGTTAAGAAGSEVVFGITTANVNVAYSAGYDTKNGSVTVKVTGFAFSFNIPLVGATITLPDYKATVTAESAGRVPADI
ncbi:MAG: pilus assembly protein [Acidobacteria bacterium]|nr:pilus assembly protein [Acidobacteriota bacterium]MBI3423686.1 pilus assembly protein [Acidobacteriota bacterium]